MSEFSLQPCTLENSPPYPSGRRKGESLFAFVRRVQVEEARKDAKNIFAAVPMHYTPGARKGGNPKRMPAGVIQMVGDPSRGNPEVARRMIYEAALAASRIDHPVSGQ